MRNLSPAYERQPQGLRTRIDTFTMRACSGSSAKILAHRGPSRSSSAKNSPSTPHQHHTRYKTLPAHPRQQHLRYKTLPALQKTPDLGTFPRAARMYSRMWIEQAEQENSSCELSRL